MTEQAADRALNAIDRAQPLQNQMAARAGDLDQRWQAWFQEPKELDQARDLVNDTRAFFGEVPDLAQATNKELLEIMMAQDFQDLTGQVIKKMMEVIQEVERQLLQVLLDNVPEGRERDEMQRRRDDSLINGPQIDAAKEDVVSSQDQVDSLLDELGF